MIASLRPYSTYRPSGVPWLGDVPEHWEEIALKRLGSFRSGAGFPIQEQGENDLELPFFKVSDMNLHNNEKVMRSWNNSVTHDTAVRLGANIFSPGTIIFPKVGGALLTNKRRVVGQPCCIDNNLMGCTVHNGNPQFVLLTLEHIDLAKIAKPGPVPAISESEIRELRVTVPPLPEQAAIVRFLDHADEQIKRYIAGKERLIALLEEERQALVHQAVTRGLDSNVKLKPSGMEWLGDVPEHWNITAVKREYEIQMGKMLQPQAKTQADIEAPYLKALNVQWYSVQTDNAQTMWAKHEEVEQLEILPGDLLVCEGGEGGRAGIVTTIPRGFIIQNALHRVRPRGRAENQFLQHLMRVISNSGWFEAINSKATIAHFTKEKFEALQIPIPPSDEQATIVEHLDKETANIDAAIVHARRHMNLMNEYRTRLIADVVTGQLDVREAAAQLEAAPRAAPSRTELRNE